MASLLNRACKEGAWRAHEEGLLLHSERRPPCASWANLLKICHFYFSEPASASASVPSLVCQHLSPPATCQPTSSTTSGFPPLRLALRHLTWGLCFAAWPLKSRRGGDTSVYLIQPAGQLGAGWGGQWQQGDPVLELNVR